MAIQVTCRCGQHFTVPDGGLPRTISCHNCGGRMVLTEPDRVEWAPGAETIQTEAAPQPSARRTSTPRRHADVCPDCGGLFAPIKLVARGPENPFSGAAVDAEVKFYAEADAKRGAWFGMFTQAGVVRTVICTSCGRIFLYGSHG